MVDEGEQLRRDILNDICRTLLVIFVRWYIDKLGQVLLTWTRYKSLGQSMIMNDPTHQSKSVSVRSNTVASRYIVPDALCEYDVPDR